MALSKEARIKIFIAIDTIFFLLEIIAGYYTHSLALVADAFHMLNDVISLFVGLWAVRVATRRPSSNEYTYGWDRAELIGGLFNGVFLIALCLTIFLDAIERFINPPQIDQPVVVLVIGGIGLLFNILGLFVFHQHDHGGHDHSHDDHDEHAATHSEEDGMSRAEQGKSHHSIPNSHATDAHDVDRRKGIAFADPPKPEPTYGSFSPSRRRSRAASNVDNLPIYPRNIRERILSDARMPDPASLANEGEYSGEESAVADENALSGERSPLLRSGKRSGSARSGNRRRDSQSVGANHKDHYHNTRKGTASGGHAHSHADMNIRGMFLHVLGDALGNVGVMASALIIWLATGWKERNYVDPAISLVITLIILRSAIPLVKDTSKPLLQAVPSHISVDDVRDDIKDLPGVCSCHDIHVWALTPSKLIATLHVKVDFDFEGRNVSRYMELAKEIKSCLHGHGIHSSTIQPEVCTEKSHTQSGSGEPGENPGDLNSSSKALHASTDRHPTGGQRKEPRNDDDDACLLDCNDACTIGKQCCGPSGSSSTSPKADSHEHTPR